MKPIFLSIPPPDRAHWLRFKCSSLAGLALRLAGWQIDWHGLPQARGVILAYPHTSNWDFMVGILVKWAVGVPIRFWAKEGLFTGVARYTLGPWMRYVGAIRIDRGASNGMIANTVAEMQRSEFAWLALAPEGTRKYATHWRSGFYRVAVQAQLPLGLAYFDFKNKVLGVTEFIELTGDEALDLARIRSYYALHAHGYTPANASPIVFKP